MKRLIIVRHGRDEEGFLGREGEGDIAQLSIKLRKILGEDDSHTRLIVSSNAPHCMRSAILLGKACDARLLRCQPILRSDRCAPNLLGIALLIASYAAKAESLIVVTDLRCTREIPRYFAKHVLQFGIKRVHRVKHGCAVVIDCEHDAVHFV